MRIFELSINNKRLNIDGIFLERVNNVLSINYENMYYFLESFFSTDDITNNIMIGNRVINNKNSFIINLLDYESIQQQLSFKKGSIAYEYLYQELTENTIENEQEINDLLESMTKNIALDSLIEYEISFKVDISKIISSFSRIKHDYELKSYKLLVKELIKKYIQNSPRKMVVLLVNIQIFKGTFDDILDCVIFNFNCSKNCSIFIGNQITNFDENTIVNHIVLNWPITTTSDFIRNLLTRCIKEYYSLEIDETTNVEIYIFNFLFSKLMNIEYKMKYIGHNDIPDSYKKFIEDLHNNIIDDKI